MFKRVIPCLAVALAIGGCGGTPERDAGKIAKTYMLDWPGEQIRATLEYRSLRASRQGPACAGSLRIENYGSKRYTVLMFSVKIFSASNALIATDRFSLSSNLNPGSKAEIPVDPHNPLNPVEITTRYGECPKNMARADVKLEAF